MFNTIDDTYMSMFKKQDILTEEDAKDTSNIKLKFSNDLAQEFASTINQFTDVCAKVVQTKAVTEQEYDKLKHIYEKIEDLLNAAEKNVF